MEELSNKKPIKITKNGVFYYKTKYDDKTI
jgi:hypothetical protein